MGAGYVPGGGRGGVKISSVGTQYLSEGTVTCWAQSATTPDQPAMHNPFMIDSIHRAWCLSGVVLQPIYLTIQVFVASQPCRKVGERSIAAAGYHMTLLWKHC